MGGVHVGTTCCDTFLNKMQYCAPCFPGACLLSDMHVTMLAGGSIVNIASTSSFIAQPGFVPYSTTKGAILQLSKCSVRCHPVWVCMHMWEGSCALYGACLLVFLPAHIMYASHLAILPGIGSWPIQHSCECGVPRTHPHRGHPQTCCDLGMCTPLQHPWLVVLLCVAVHVEYGVAHARATWITHAPCGVVFQTHRARRWMRWWKTCRRA